jgi:alkylated DNA repair dioxygenase AlkB
MPARSQLQLIKTETFPDGFRYQGDVLSPADERALAGRIEGLPFKAFEFRGFEGKRRVVSYGWRYDFNKQKVERADPVPDFLLPVRERAAAFADLVAEELEQVSVIEYRPGSAIGWHKDRPMFGDVTGVSLLSACRFRFRRERGKRWERINLTVEPRSIYLLRGPSREEWQHSIPAVDTLRYSITMRTFRGA